MFDTRQQFFPTPDHVVSIVWRKLFEFKSTITNVLDPSAGKGDLLDGWENYKHRHGCYKVKGYAVEIDPELQMILREKGYKVIGRDFLEYSEPLEFPVILMNPPFNQGVAHVLKAWSLLKSDGVLIALLNQEPILNPCTSERSRLVKLVEQFGGYELLGKCFRDAERKTDVDVAMVWLKRPETEINPSEFRFSTGFRQADDGVFEEFTANPLAKTDAIETLIAQYQACLNTLKAKCQAESELSYHLKSLGEQSGTLAALRDDNLNEVTEYFTAVQQLKYRFWWAVFKLSRISEISTSHFRDKFDEFVSAQSVMAFDRSAILEVLAIFFQNKEQIMIDSAVAVFDSATRFHEKNTEHSEGWKTNSGWKINQKIILPYGLQWEPLFNSWRFYYSNRMLENFLNDLDEVLAWLSGDKYDASKSTANMIQSYGAFKNSKTLEPGQWIDSKYYQFKLYKKGTIHIRFNDKELLAKLNRAVAQGKNWIGGEGY